MTKVNRWYTGFSYTGNAKQLVDSISEKVLKHDLSQYVPLVRIEKGVRRRTFYFFLAIESSLPGQLPTELQSSLMLLPFFRYPIKGKPSFSYEEIESMVGAAHDVHDYTHPIPYLETKDIRYDDPFDIITPSTLEPSIPNIERLSQQYQQLLYWLSSVGCGTWESFQKACLTLKLNDPRRIFRQFKLLGHIESSADGRHWSIASTALVSVESESENSEFILCGQQNGGLLRTLKHHGTVSVTNQPRGDAPPCLRVQLSDSIEFIRSRLGVEVTNVGDVALRLATILPEIENWKLGLRNVQGIVTILYNWKRFDGNNFVECIFPQQTGMYQMWDRSESDRPRLTLFYDAETETWRQGDWYGLRFLALHHSNQICMARYDFATKRLAVPYSQRWPELYERALVLASGYLPTYQKTEQNLWLIYENVKQDLAQLLMEKLGISCSESSV